MKSEDIVARIRENYPDASIQTEGSDCSFEVSVVTPAFEGVSLLKRQQPLLSLFKGEINSGELHALTIRALTPAETGTE